jgi:mevalonate kinase
VVSTKQGTFIYISEENVETQQFNAQGSRVIIVVIKVGGAVKRYVAAVEALRKTERGDDETEFTTKIGGKT